MIDDVSGKVLTYARFSKLKKRHLKLEKTVARIQEKMGTIDQKLDNAIKEAEKTKLDRDIVVSHS